MKMLNAKGKMFFKLTLSALLVMAFQVFAQTETVIMPPTTEEISALMKQVGGLGGVGVYGIIAFVIQAIMMVLRAIEVKGIWRLFTVLGLSLVGGVISSKAMGMDWVQALFNSTTLAAFQVLVNQIMIQVKKAPTERPEAKA